MDVQDFMDETQDKLDRLEVTKVNEADLAAKLPQRVASEVKIDGGLKNDIEPLREQFDLKFEQLDQKIIKLRRDCRIDQMSKLLDKAAFKDDLDMGFNIVDCQLYDLDQNF